MKTSERGIKFLERHEGVVLRAYRDVAGVWTIGAGLTKASGVVVPRAGMVITRAQATALLGRALAGRYEPGVAAAMPGARAHEFDAGVCFHYNTGAIARASWVAAWKQRDWPAVRSGLAAWCRAGGKVVRGLSLRRQAEYELLHQAHYGDGGDVRPAARPDLAAWSPLTVSAAERETVRRTLIRLGYKAGDQPGDVLRAAALAFQRAHALTPDGVIGRATRATIERMAGARARLAFAGVATTAPVATTSAIPTDLPALGDHPALIVLPGLIWLGWLSWTHRDALAAVIQHRLPRLARYLRSL